MPTKIWEPTARQVAFISLPYSVFEALYGGAAGGGKTETLLMLPIVCKDKNGNPLYKHSKFKMLFLRRTFPELDLEVIPRSQEIYKAVGFLPFQDQKKRWTHPNGSIIQFGHCEYEKDVKKYDTSEYNIIAFDEATSFTPYQYEYLAFSRCRSSSPELPAIVRAGTNPGNIGHSYFRKRFVEPCKEGNVILRESRKLHGKSEITLRIFIPSKLQDNPHLMQSDPGYLVRINKLPEKERAAKADGDWYAFSGQVFSDFRENHIPGEPDNALHVIKPFPIPDYWAKVLAIDWGYSAKTIAGWYAINPKPCDKYPAKIYKFYEYSALKTNISTWGKHIGQISAGMNLVDIVLDPSAWGHRGDEFTIAEQFEQASGLRARKADNDRVGGKLAIQEYLRWQSRDIANALNRLIHFDQTKALELYRTGGVQALERYEASFKLEIAENYLPKFQIFDICTETIKVIPLCIYKKDKDKQVAEANDEGNSEDVEEFRGDDAYDETRYGLKACQYYLENGKEEHERLSRIQQACSVVEQGNASPSQITKFYMDMANLEQAENISKRPIRRFHGTRLKHANF